MSTLPFTLLDLIVIAIVLISALLALSRGFVREVLTLVCWIGAGAVAYFAFTPLRPMVLQAVHNDLVADLVTAAVVFLVPLIVFKLLAGMITRGVEDSRMGFLDRILGLLFGIARGVVLVAAAWLVVGLVIKPDRQPDWVQHAYLRPQIERGASILAGLLPADLADQSRATADAAVERARELRGQPADGKPGTAGDQGYTGAIRQKLDQFLSKQK
jgi:membrane protein required for colicin V production